MRCDGYRRLKREKFGSMSKRASSSVISPPLGSTATLANTAAGGHCEAFCAQGAPVSQSALSGGGIRRLKGSEGNIARGCQTWHVGDRLQGGLSGRESC